MLRRASMAGIAVDLVVAMFSSQGRPELAHASLSDGFAASSSC